MGGYQIELASEKDDAELRHVLAETPMPGKISVTFLREPSFFKASSVDGTFRQIAVCREKTSRKIVGLGCRSLREVFINGSPATVGYLSTLRILEAHRNTGLVPRLFRFLRELHKDRRAELYLTTIAEGNERATSLLGSGRAGLPVYHPAGQYHTVAIPIPKRRTPVPLETSVLIRPAEQEDCEMILEFLNRVGPSRQFFPKYLASDFFSSESTFKELLPRDLPLVFREGRLVGTMGGWNQEAFRQTIVKAYHFPLSLVRPVYNFWANLRGLPRLPDEGKAFRYLMGCLPLVEPEEPEVIVQLIRRLLNQFAGTRQEYLLLGLHEADPLLPNVKALGAMTYISRLYYAVWQEEEAVLDRLDDRPPYLELGCL